MLVEIYTDTSLRGLKSKRAEYAAIVVARRENRTDQRTVVADEKDTTYHRASLLAVLAGLKILNRACDNVVVHSPDTFLVNMVNTRKIEEWKREEWKRSQNKDVMHKELWQQLEEAIGKHKISFVNTKQSEKTEELHKLMEEYRKENKDVR